MFLKFIIMYNFILELQESLDCVPQAMVQATLVDY